MKTIEKLCLKWNNFQANLYSAFGRFRDDLDFADVTLASDDGKQFETHKIILASSSPFFMEVLRKNKHPHPLIYMRGMKSENLFAIIDFLYYGMANVFQENLDSFLSIAEEFELKGLMGQGNNTREKKSDEIGSQPNNSRKNGPEQNGQLKSKCEVTRDNSTNLLLMTKC